MKSILFLSTATLVLFLSIHATPEANPSIVFGNYGGDGNTAPRIELNADNTFHYIDNTKPAKPIDITGKWEVSNNELHLMNVENKHVMTEFEIMREGMCLKARKGMAFYTLCNCD